MNHHLHLNPKVTKAGIGLCLVALLAIGGFAHIKKAHAEEAQQPDGSARIEVVDSNGTRACDIYGTDSTTRAQFEAYAKEAGCKIKAWYKSVRHTETPVVADESAQPSTAVAPVAQPVVPAKVPALSVTQPSSVALTK